MPTREQIERFSTTVIPALYLVYSRWIDPYRTAQLLGSDDLRALSEHSARGFLMPWFGSLIVSFALDPLEPNNQSERKSIRDIAPVGFGILGLTLWTLCSELLTQPAVLNRPPQWDQIISEVGACAIGVVSERVYRQVNHHHIRP